MDRNFNSTPEARLAKKIKVEFKNSQLLHQALIHRSYLNENIKEKQSNERLEFLGDAVLEFLVSQKLFELLPNQKEGELTALRAKMVNTNALGSVGQKLEIGEALYLSRGEEASGGRENKTLLANAVEALIGAIALDQGIEKTKEFINEYIIDTSKLKLRELKDAKTLLQERVQAQGLKAPVYKVVSQAGPDHARKFLVAVFVQGKELAQGRGKSLKMAQQEAARKALKEEKLNGKTS